MELKFIVKLMMIFFFIIKFNLFKKIFNDRINDEIKILLLINNGINI